MIFFRPEISQAWYGASEANVNTQIQAQAGVTALIERARLHPLPAELVAEVLARSEVGVARETHTEDETFDARGLLAELVAQAGDSLTDAKGRAAHVVSLALATLAEAHLLDEPARSVRSPVAERHLGTIIRERGAQLQPSTLALSRDAYDRIACAAGRADFVRRVRAEVEGLEALDPYVVDVDNREALLLGGRSLRVPYRDPSGERMRRVSTGNREGRLLLLLLSQRPPAVVGSDVVSRLRRALETANGKLVLEGSPLTVKPSLRMTPRARALADEIRGVDSPL